jgi:hypothetical protein
MKHLIFWLVFAGLATYEPVQVTKCNDTGLCVTYYENCLVLKKWR